MHDTLNNSLKQYFGFDTFRPGQKQTIAQIVAGHSSLAIFPTGSGKSLCYQLAALHLPHLTIVVSPLLALMQDQLQFLKNQGIQAATLDSTLSIQAYQQLVNELRRGELKILMVSVERFKNERFRQLVDAIPISLMVVDEAHCISEWGHNFRPDYLKLPAIQQALKIPTVLLLTATATAQVKQDMANKFNIAQRHVVQTGFYRKNLHLQVEPASDQEKLTKLMSFIQRQTGSGIIYVTLQAQAEMLASQLTQQGIKASAYHAGMAYEQRDTLQQAFMAGDVPVMVATIAFGMGVDKSDIRFVVHYEMPKSIENYSQEIGRAGRDGQAAHCLTFANLDGTHTLENFVYGDTPEPWSLSAFIDLIRQETHDGQWALQAHAVSTATNIRLLTLKTLIVQLELFGILQARYSYFSQYRVKFLVEPDVILANFQGERATFLAAIFAQCQRKKIWADLDIESVAKNYTTDRARVLTALAYLEEQGFIEMQTKGAVEVFSVNEQALVDATLPATLATYFNEKEANEINRIAHLIRFFENDVCISWQLANYFDDQYAPKICGHCSVCLGQVSRFKAYDVVEGISQGQVEQAIHHLKKNLSTKLAEQHIQYTLSAELASRFLIGLTLPWFTRFRFRQLPGFGVAQKQRYADVKKQVERVLKNQV